MQEKVVDKNGAFNPSILLEYKDLYNNNNNFTITSYVALINFDNNNGKNVTFSYNCFYEETGNIIQAKCITIQKVVGRN